MRIRALSFSLTDIKMGVERCSAYSSLHIIPIPSRTSNPCVLHWREDAANTFEDVRIHYEGGADYIGCGPFRYTTTKQKLAPILGLEGYRAITARMREEGIDLPVVGIGGVTAEDMSALAGAGLSGIALSGSVLRAADPVGEMRRVMQIAKQVSDNYGRQNQN